ncbi:MAG: S-methyl-5'-thioadenosine phosphorylase, partial [Hyphomonas sp.]|nr:S-methyl-5'-thioadenosine phosphorylase [Hyphomonas sp.]
SGTERTPDPNGTDTCLDHALITAPQARDPDLLSRLQVIAGRALNG